MESKEIFHYYDTLLAIIQVFTVQLAIFSHVLHIEIGKKNIEGM